MATPLESPAARRRPVDKGDLAVVAVVLVVGIALMVALDFASALMVVLSTYDPDGYIPQPGDHTDAALLVLAVVAIVQLVQLSWGVVCGLASLRRREKAWDNALAAVTLGVAYVVVADVVAFGLVLG